MSVETRARRDAREFARAQMFYGEGAGNRRKLISNTVAAEKEKSPLYAAAFEAEFKKQDMAEHARKAKIERRRRDAAQTTSKTTKAVVTGNYQNVSAGLFAVGSAAYFLHQTGLDRIIVDKVRMQYRRVKVSWRIRRFNRQSSAQQDAKIYNITNVK